MPWLFHAHSKSVTSCQRNLSVSFFFPAVAEISNTYIIDSNDGKSTKEALTRVPSTRAPSIIEIEASDEEGDKSEVDETPEEELGKF